MIWIQKPFGQHMSNSIALFKVVKEPDFTRTHEICIDFNWKFVISSQKEMDYFERERKSNTDENLTWIKQAILWL